MNVPCLFISVHWFLVCIHSLGACGRGDLFIGDELQEQTFPYVTTPMGRLRVTASHCYPHKDLVNESDITVISLEVVGPDSGVRHVQVRTDVHTSNVAHPIGSNIASPTRFPPWSTKPESPMRRISLSQAESKGIRYTITSHYLAMVSAQNDNSFLMYGVGKSGILHRGPLVGSFEENMLSGRFGDTPVMTISGFSARLGVGAKSQCPAPIVVNFSVLYV